MLYAVGVIFFFGLWAFGVFVARATDPAWRCSPHPIARGSCDGRVTHDHSFVAALYISVHCVPLHFCSFSCGLGLLKSSCCWFNRFYETQDGPGEPACEIRVFVPRGEDDFLPATLGDQELILQEKEFTLRGSQLDCMKEELSIADSREKFHDNPLAYDYACVLLEEDGVRAASSPVPHLLLPSLPSAGILSESYVPVQRRAATPDADARLLRTL